MGEQEEGIDKATTPTSVNISFNPQIPEPSVIPVGVDILKSDDVSHKSADFHIDYADYIFDDAKAAIESESMKDFFSWAEEFLAEYCGTNERGVYWAVELFFTTRQAREDFIDLLPGGAYIGGYFRYAGCRIY